MTFPSKWATQFMWYCTRTVGRTPPKYATGRELLVLVGKNTITYNDMLGRSLQVPIESQRPVTNLSNRNSPCCLRESHARGVFSGVTVDAAIRVDLEEECIVCLFEGTKRAAASTDAHLLVSGHYVVLRHWRIGPEPRSSIEGGPTVQHSGHSSPRFPKHKKQLQRDFVR